MRIVAVVQARMGSSRLPGKVARLVRGVTLLERMLERVSAARSLDEVVVATTRRPEDEAIVQICRPLRVPVYAGHPTDLLDRHLQAARASGAEALVKIPSDCPLIDPQVIDRVVGFYRAEAAHFDFVSNLHPASYPDGNDVEVVPLGVLEEADRQAVKPHEREHTTPFVWDQPDRFRIGNVAWPTGLDYSMSHRFTVDYPEDLAFVQAVFEALYQPGEPPFTLEDILALLQRRPEIFQLNRHLAGVNWYRHHLAELRTVGGDQAPPRGGSMILPPTDRASDRASPPAPSPHAELEARALKVREHIVRMSGGGGCFIGASLSCADLVVYLYSRVLRVTPATRQDPGRDYFFLSKGHDVPALYGTLAELGYIERRRLDCHLDPEDHLYWHPSRQVPGVEFHSGSLGHLLAVAVGVALDIKLRGAWNRVFVLLGDGELDEGSVWEAALCASAKGLDNLVAIIDRNGFQANIETERLIPLEPLEDKFRAFGFAAHTFDGHAFGEMAEAFERLPLRSGQPTALIARTLRGRGLPSLEGRVDRWFARFSPEEVEMLLAELGGAARADSVSPTLVVR